MAQKKVILKDGGNDLLPKTLASMVFTEAGQTVEEALQSAGGGGSSSGGGTGNVNVTNASSLSKDNYYAFKPSANGSVKGKFETIPYASGTVSGLMSASDYNKLAAIRTTIDLPSGLKDLTAESTDEQVFDVFAAIITSAGVSLSTNYPNDKMIVGYYGCLIIAMIQTGQDGYDFHWTLDNNPVSASFEVQSPDETSGQQYPIKGSASFTYVTSGRLRTTTLTATLNSSGDTATYDFKAKVEESGDDTYYLLSDILYLKSGATQAEIDTAFGGEGKFGKALVAASSKKKLYIYNSALGLIPVAASLFSSVSGTLSFVYHDHIGNITYIKYIKKQEVHIIYPSGYSLRPSLYSLATSSSSDDISAAVGGESGLKEIIQAVKDGNRLVIRGTAPDSISSVTDQLSADVSFASYKESENGDITLVYTLFGMTQGNAYFGASTYVISYTKSSNTFAIQKANIAHNI